MNIKAEAIRKFRQFEPLSTEERNILRDPLCHFLEVILKTGDIHLGLESLVENISLAQKPSTRGMQPLIGMLTLTGKSPDDRDLILYALTILKQIALEDHDEGVLPWILQGTKLAYLPERFHTYTIITWFFSKITDEILADWADDFISSLTSQKFPHDSDACLMLVDALSVFKDSRWAKNITTALSKKTISDLKMLEPLQVRDHWNSLPQENAIVDWELLQLKPGFGGTAQWVAAVSTIRLAGGNPVNHVDEMLSQIEKLSPSAVLILSEWLLACRTKLDQKQFDQFKVLDGQFRHKNSYIDRLAFSAISELILSQDHK